MYCFILGENGRVSRFNSGDLAGKCAALFPSVTSERSNRQQKMCFAENICSSLSHFRLFVNFRNYLGKPDGFSARSAIFCCH